MNSIYPVGSLYFCTQSTCPMASLISGSTWEKVGSSLITSVNTSVPVKGNGIAVGFTNGTSNFGATNKDGDGSFKGLVGLSSDAFGKSVSTTGITRNMSLNGVFGITTDSSKSGIVGTVTRSSLTVNIFKRTA